MRYSLHKIDKGEFNSVNIPFSPTKYSKFKFGDKAISREFGIALAKGYIADHLSKYPIEQQIVVCSSPYCFIPTATFAMKNYFVQTLNNHLVKNGLRVVEETKIHRTITYKEDYGALDAESRMKLIGKDGFHMDKEFVKGKTILFLDDVYITGSHENMILNMMDRLKLKNDFVFIYFGQLVSKEIHPNIENILNYAFVKGLLDLDKIIKNEDFLLNTRVVKYILNSPETEFQTFIQYQKQVFVQTLYHQAIGNSYHLIEEYRPNLTYIQKLLKNNL